MRESTEKERKEGAGEWKGKNVNSGAEKVRKKEKKERRRGRKVRPC